MKCKGCGIISERCDRKCWVKHSMCVKCAVKNHPEDYPKNFQQRYLGLKLKKKVYEVCPFCNSINIKMKYQHTGKLRDVGSSYCRVCNIIFGDSKVRFVQLSEVAI